MKPSPGPKRSLWSPLDFGAAGDGVSFDTSAFQKAIDCAHEAGGGEVRVPPGRFCTGTLELKSGVKLHLEKGSVLLGAPAISHYRRGYWPALIKARGQRDIAIEGEGTIDGQGKLVAADTERLWESGDLLALYPGFKPGDTIATWTGDNVEKIVDPYRMHAAGTLAPVVAPRPRDFTWRVDEHVRPQLLEFWECQGVRVAGVTLRNAANWVQTYRDSSDILIQGIKVDSITYWNNDGIDVVNCQRVRIEDCDVNSADDGICLKSEPSRNGLTCDDIQILRCRVRSSASALKLGTASHTAFRNITITDIEVHDTFRSVLAIESVDGALIENIKVSHVRARNTGNALFLGVNQRFPTKPAGALRNIEISDFVVQVPSGKPDAGYEHEGPPEPVPTNLIPSLITGLPESPVENVVLRDISITYGGGSSRQVAEIPLDRLTEISEKRGAYPEFSMFGELPAWAFFVRHARGIRFENVHFKLEKPDFRPAMVFDRVDGLRLASLEIGPGGGAPVLLANEVRDVELNQVPFTLETPPVRQ